jgi:hypothetical protein
LNIKRVFTKIAKIQGINEISSNFYFYFTFYSRGRLVD